MKRVEWVSLQEGTQMCSRPPSHSLLIVTVRLLELLFHLHFLKADVPKLSHHKRTPRLESNRDALFKRMVGETRHRLVNSFSLIFLRTFLGIQPIPNLAQKGPKRQSWTAGKFDKSD